MFREFTLEEIEDAIAIELAPKPKVKWYDVERVLILLETEIEKNRFQDDRRIRGLKDTYNKFRQLKKAVPNF